MNKTPLTIPPEALISLAIDVHRQNQLEEAETLYRRVLQDRPRHVDALHFLGVLLHQRGHSEEAVRTIRSAVQENPRYVDARINLGNILKEMGRYAESESQYRLVIQMQPENAKAFNNLGAVLRAQGKLEQAIDAYLDATELAPGEADTYQNLGNAYKAAHRIEDALTAFRQAIEIDQSHSDANLSLGRALYRFGRLDEAATVYSKWLEIDPENAIAKHMLESCRGGRGVQRCSDAFVRESFDAFASSFEEVLSRLDYCAPALVADMIGRYCGPPEPSFEILDAGCGTGLCGSALRGYAKHLVGVDLSPMMLQKAKATGRYDELVNEELTAYLNQQSLRFDVINSADTLNYFGSLTDVFDAAANALKPGALLTFTLEHSQESEDPNPYTLHPHGRFSHREDYVRQQLDASGLQVCEVRHDVLRKEVYQPVQGLTVIARRVEQ